MPTVLHYVIVVLIWGTSWLAIKYQLGLVAPEMSIAYRFLLAFVILAAYCAVKGRSLRFPRAVNLLILGQGLSLFCINYILFYLAAQHLVTGLLSVLFSTITVMNLTNAHFLFGQKIEPGVALGAMLGLIGIALVFWPEIADLDWHSGAVIGLVLSILATYSASHGNMASMKLGLMGVPVMEANTLGMGIGALGAMAWALLGGADFVYDPRPIYSLSLLFVSLFASVIGFGCFLTLIRRIGAGRAAYATVLFPLIALALSTWFEDYHWPVEAVPGVGLVLIGNILALRRKRGARPSSDPVKA